MTAFLNNVPGSLHVERLIELAIDEDLGHGDITTEALGMEESSGRAVIVAKEPMVVAGLDIVRRVYEKFDSGVFFRPLIQDGHRVQPEARVAEIKANMGALLSGERIALNFLQRLSGIATNVRRYAGLIPDLRVRLTDTRKTTPGWRVLEKYAVRAGGAFNHRMGLFDGVLIKDNHIAACGGITQAVEKIRARVSHLIKIEVETESLDQVKDALNAGADVIMLDNMSREDIEQAVKIIDGRALVEVSGGIDLEGLRDLCSAGVDIISAGALTHAARSVDLGMYIEPAT
ncbi:MAG: carboxylating nicotinate-nucleotide diphosphorylase [Desulfobacteraceae bacterium]|nr:carboxylating nicotinate-nucleotide diphosphorylase [Desulfobacteraceae bacterium]